MKTKIIFVGGFLGAGKTTLLSEAAKIVSAQGKRVGLITNDQASELVDTALLEHGNAVVSEVSGSCFCCNYKGLEDAVTQMHAAGVEIIIAEPVGSCTDLSATLLQPLKQRLSDDIQLAPLSVLVDPNKLSDLLKGGTAGMHESAAYIMNKQLEEGDIIIISKSDLLTKESNDEIKIRSANKWPLATIIDLSAKSGENIDTWMNEVLNREESGTHIAQVDYEVYAEGEAVLGWLNTTISLHSKSIDWDIFTKNYLDRLSRRFDDSNYAIGHVKLLIEVSDRYAIGNLTGKVDSLNYRGSVGLGESATMTLNARVQMDPEELKEIVLEELDFATADDISSTVLVLKCLKPGRPNPTYRCENVVLRKS